MNIITNESMIKRNARISQVSMIAGLAVLAGGMYISFKSTDPRYFYISLLSLLLGFILSQVGIYYANNFGRHPRPDEIINLGLKGLDGKYTLYHYMTPVPHLLVGPAGVWILMTRSQKGRITFVNGRWRQKGGNLYLKLFAQEGLGRPDIDLEGQVGKLTQYFQKNLTEGVVPPLQAVLVFTNPSVVIDIPEETELPVETIKTDKLKETMRKAAKSKSISPTAIQQITALFPEESK
jgi:hypothetical protein